MFPVSEFTACINPGQGAILAVGGGIKKVVPPTVSIEDIDAGTVDVAPTVANTITVQLSADARAIDQRTAARFLEAFATYMNSPKSLVL